MRSPYPDGKRLRGPVASAALTLLLIAVSSACSRSEEPAVVTLPERSSTTSIPTMLAPDDGTSSEELPTEPLEVSWIVQIGGPGDDAFNGVTAVGSIGGEPDVPDDGSTVGAPPNLVAVGSTNGNLTEPHPERPDDSGPGQDGPGNGSGGEEAPPATVPDEHTTTSTTVPAPSGPPPSVANGEPAVLASRISGGGKVIRSDVLDSSGPASATSVATVRAPGTAEEAASMAIGCGFSFGDLAGPAMGSSDGWCGPVATTLDEPGAVDDLARIFGFGFTPFAAESNETINGIDTTTPGDDPDLAARQNMFLAGTTDGMFPGAGDSAGRGMGQGDVLAFRTSLRDGTSWIRQFGTPFPDASTDVCTTGGHGYFTGWTDGDLAGQSAGGRDGWISMIDSEGLQRWLIQFGYAADEEFHSVACTGNPAEGTQQFVAVGSTTGDGPKKSNGGSDALVASFAPDGSTLWATQFGGSGYDSATAVVVADDIIYVVGTTDSPAEPTDAANEDDTTGNEDDTAGNDTDTDRPTTTRPLPDQPSPDADGHTVTFGSVDEAVGPGGSKDGFLTAIDARTGEILWTSRFGSEVDDSAAAVTITADGLLVVAGTTSGALGDFLSAGGTDGYAIAFTLPSSGGAGGAQSWV